MVPFPYLFHMAHPRLDDAGKTIVLASPSFGINVHKMIEDCDYGDPNIGSL
jgi:hypothetical protein